MRMNVNAPYRELGPQQSDADYCFQNGKIFNWSESNLGYEHAWWLTDAGDPINDSNHVKNLLCDRPFNKEWLSS